MVRIRFSLALMFALVLSCVGAFAQTASKVDIFGGAEYRFVPNGNGINAPGWEASATYNFVPTFGATADFDGIYANGGSSYTYLFGPTVKFLQKTHFTVFGDALFGIAHSGVGSASVNNFAFATGGGVDIPLSKNFSVRPVKLEYLLVDSKSVSNTLRYSGGMVFSF